MNRFLPIILIFALPAVVFAAKVEMPEWEETASAEEYKLGGGLWPTASKSTDGEPSSTEGAVAKSDVAGGAETAEGSGETKGQAVKFYGPAGEVVEVTPSEEGEKQLPNPKADGNELLKFPDEEVAREVPIEALPPLEGKLADTYFEHAPMDFLIDPQRLLTEQKSNDIKRFLEFHSDESNFHIFVMVFGETQKIPEDIDMRKLHKEWFSETPTVVMLYYREHPEMTELVFSDKVSSSLPKSVFDRIRQNCLREGAATDLAPDQVEKMAIELSIQLYWLTRLMAHETTEAQSLAAEKSVHEMAASADAPELLREYAPGIFVEVKGRKVLSIVLTTLLVLGTIVAVAFVGWGILWWRNRDRVAGKPLLFPSFQIVPRLGGEFSGGAFVSMSFEINDGSDFAG